MTAPATTATFTPASPTKEKFKKRPGESLNMKGNLSYVKGEVGIKNLLSGKCRVTECTVFLTNERLVATKARRSFPWGPLVWLVRSLFARKILFSIPLAQVTAIKLDPARRSEMILQTAAGGEFKLTCNAIFSKTPKWVAALTSAVTQSSPGTTAEQSESAVTFVR